ncbi:MAG: FAD:protein FMN transferase [Planctomycetota bacterium]
MPSESPAAMLQRPPARLLLPALGVVTLLVGGILSTPSSATDGERELLLRERRLGIMGTELQIETLGPDGTLLDRAIDEAIAELRRVEDLMTDWRPSPLTRLNDAAGKGPQEAPEELLDLIARSVEVWKLTEGAFDITFAAVGRLWDFMANPPRIPDPEEIREGIRRLGSDRIRIDREAGTIELPEGVQIGLGGIAKGYGVDRAMAVLRRHGIEHALVNAGGDLKVLGRKQGRLWKIAIRHPRDEERVLALLPVSNTSVVTSGDYERFFVKDGERFHHIIDPRTGYPSEGCMSATVVAPDAAIADALATAFCVLPREKGMELAEKLPRVEALLVGMDGSLQATTGLMGAVEEAEEEAPPSPGHEPPYKG